MLKALNVFPIEMSCCRSPWPCLPWASQLPSPLEGRGNHSAEGYKGNATTSGCVSIRISIKEQRPARNPSCSRHYPALQPRTPGGLQRTLREGAEHGAGGEGPLSASQNISQPRGRTFQAGFTRTSPLFLCTSLAGSPTLPSRFKAKAQDLPKALGTVLAFGKLSFIVFNENSPRF